MLKTSGAISVIVVISSLFSCRHGSPWSVRGVPAGPAAGPSSPSMTIIMETRTAAHDHPLPSGAPCSLQISDPQGGGDGATSEDAHRLHADVPDRGGLPAGDLRAPLAAGLLLSPLRARACLVPARPRPL